MTRSTLNLLPSRRPISAQAKLGDSLWLIDLPKGATVREGLQKIISHCQSLGFGGVIHQSGTTATIYYIPRAGKTLAVAYPGVNISLCEPFGSEKRWTSIEITAGSRKELIEKIISPLK